MISNNLNKEQLDNIWQNKPYGYFNKLLENSPDIVREYAIEISLNLDTDFFKQCIIKPVTCKLFIEAKSSSDAKDISEKFLDHWQKEGFFHSVKIIQ